MVLSNRHVQKRPDSFYVLYERENTLTNGGRREASAQEALASGSDDPSDRPSNGRAVRNLIESIQRSQAVRLAEMKRPKTMDDLTTIVEADVMPCVQQHL
eukprot:1189430-Prorocentrum_minimum.AAC.1